MATNVDLTMTIRAVDQASSVVRGIVSAVQGLASGNYAGAIAGVGLAIGGVGIALGAAVQAASNYQQQLNMIQALTGATTQQMQQYSAGIRQMSMDTGASTDTLSQGLYYVISAGYQGADALNVLDLATKDAVIGMTDAQTTANALTTVLRGFSIPMNQAAAANGEMLQTVTLGKMTMAQYAGAIAKVASVSKQYGVSFEATNASIATLTANGVKSAAIAGTDVIHLEELLMGNTSTIAKNMQTLGIGFNQAKFDALDFQDRITYLNNALKGHNVTISQVIGKSLNAAQAYTILTQHASTLKNDLSQLSNQQKNAAATQDAWNITQKGFAVQSQKAQAALNDIGITIGTALLPYLTKLLGAITPILVQFANWLEKSKSLKTGLATTFHDIYIAFKTTGDLIQLQIDLITGNWQDMGVEINNLTNGQWHNIQQTIMGGMQDIVNFLIGAGNAIFDAIIQPFYQAYNAVASLMGAPQAALPTFGSVSFTSSSGSSSASGGGKFVFGTKASTKKAASAGAAALPQNLGAVSAPGSGGSGAGTSTSKAKAAKAPSPQSYTAADIKDIEANAKKMHLAMNDALFAAMTSAQKTKYLDQLVGDNRTKLAQILKGTQSGFADYIEWELSQAKAKTTAATTKAKTSSSALTVGGVTGTSATAAAASQGSSGFTVINNIGSITITSTINAGNSDAKQVYNLVMKQLNNDIKRSGLFASMTSSGVSAKK